MPQVNALVAAQIPLMVGEDTTWWLPFGFAVPWSEIVWVVNRTDFRRDPARAVMAVADGISDARRERARRLMISALPDLIYNTIGSSQAPHTVHSTHRHRAPSLSALC